MVDECVVSPTRRGWHHGAVPSIVNEAVASVSSRRLSSLQVGLVARVVPGGRLRLKEAAKRISCMTVRTGWCLLDGGEGGSTDKLVFVQLAEQTIGQPHNNNNNNNNNPPWTSNRIASSARARCWPPSSECSHPNRRTSRSRRCRCCRSPWCPRSLLIRSRGRRSPPPQTTPRWWGSAANPLRGPILRRRGKATVGVCDSGPA